jgi:hypothetical protein
LISDISLSIISGSICGGFEEYCVNERHWPLGNQKKSDANALNNSIHPGQRDWQVLTNIQTEGGLFKHSSKPG